MVFAFSIVWCYSHYSAAVETCNNYPSLAPKPPEKKGQCTEVSMEVYPYHIASNTAPQARGALLLPF